MGPNWNIHFYTDNNGRQPAKDFLNALTPKEQAAFRTRLKYVVQKGLRVRKDVMTDLTNERNLYRLRLLTQNNPRFLLCALSGRRLYLLNGFKEKSKRDYNKAIRIARSLRDDCEHKYGP